MNWIASIAALFLTFSFTLQSAAATKTYKGLGKDSVTAQELKKYAPPPLRPELADRIQKKVEITAPGVGMLSPDGKSLYFTWRISGNNQVWKMDSLGSFPIQLTSGKDPTYIADIFPDGSKLVLSRDHQGQENPGILFLDLNSGLLETFFQKEKVQSAFMGFSETGDSFFYRANDKDPESFTIYQYFLKTKVLESLVSEKGTWSLADQKGQDLLLHKYTGSRSTEVYLFSLANKRLVALLGQNESQSYDVKFGAGDKEFLVKTDKFDDFNRLYQFKEGQWKKISPDVNWDVSGSTIDKRRQRILININEGGYTKLIALDAKTFKPIKDADFAKKFPNAKHVIPGITTKDGRYTMLRVVTAQNPSTSYALDWKTMKYTQWVQPSAPEVDLTNFVDEKLEEYTTRDGVKIPMFVHRPRHCKKEACPVVVSFHGGPEGQSTAGFSPFAQLFVDEGFIFVEPNVRGSVGYGKAWLDSDNGPLREKVITDIEDCAQFIKKNWSATKVGVTGGSYGGYATFMAMTKFAGAYDAGVAIVGMSNLVTFLENTAPYRRHLRTSEYGDLIKDRESLVRLSPVTYIQKVQDPILIIQGANDPRVPVGEALQMHKLLNKKKLSELILFSDEGHGSQNRDNSILQIGHTLNFFNQHLKEKAKP